MGKSQWVKGTSETSSFRRVLLANDEQRLRHLCQKFVTSASGQANITMIPSKDWLNKHQSVARLFSHSHTLIGQPAAISWVVRCRWRAERTQTARRWYTLLSDSFLFHLSRWVKFWSILEHFYKFKTIPSITQDNVQFNHFPNLARICNLFRPGENAFCIIHFK